LERVADAQVADDLAACDEHVVSQLVCDDAETYMNAVTGVDVEAVCLGPGDGPSQVLTASDDRLALTSSTVGFPMLSRTHVADDKICVAYMVSTTPGSRWCEMGLEAGAVVAYAPSAEHTARNLPGTSFVFAVTGQDELGEHADRLGVRLHTPTQGEVHLLAPSAATSRLGPAFERFADQLPTGEYPSPAIADDVLEAMAHALSDDDHRRRVGANKRIDRRRVVHACVDYANSTGRIPSISELCLAAHVSERSLREAFTDEYDVPPSQFFRAWALTEAHARLAHGGDEKVTNVAVDLGFEHLGRFSRYYKEIHGETPSCTRTHR
jgi:AraC-like DNA-binding protein